MWLDNLVQDHSHMGKKSMTGNYTVEENTKLHTSPSTTAQATMTMTRLAVLATD